jgi:hypothetical protein
MADDDAPTRRDSRNVHASNIAHVGSRNRLIIVGLVGYPIMQTPDKRDGGSRRRRFTMPKHSPAREAAVRKRNRPQIARD